MLFPHDIMVFLYSTTVYNPHLHCIHQLVVIVTGLQCKIPVLLNFQMFHVSDHLFLPCADGLYAMSCNYQRSSLAAALGQSSVVPAVRDEATPLVILPGQVRLIVIYSETCYERPLVLKDQIFLAQGSVFQCY